ncbi:uncharacterized protein LOC144055122 [Vanacampus margaritifer]
MAGFCSLARGSHSAAFGINAGAVPPVRGRSRRAEPTGSQKPFGIEAGTAPAAHGGRPRAAGSQRQFGIEAGPALATHGSRAPVAPACGSRLALRGGTAPPARGSRAPTPPAAVRTHLRERERWDRLVSSPAERGPLLFLSRKSTTPQPGPASLPRCFCELAGSVERQQCGKRQPSLLRRARQKIM